MKKCFFCAEEIQDDAIKCRFCNEFLDETTRPRPKTKWYYSTSAIVVSLLIVGPFALPLLWKNPKYKIITKIIITILVIAVTIWLCYLVGNMYKRIIEQINALGLQ